MGVTGIILATIITIFVFNFIIRTNILFRYYFKISKMKFYRLHLFYFIVTCISGMITYILCLFIPIDGILGLGLKGIVCVIVPNVIYFVLYHETNEFKVAVTFVKKIFNKT
mgnify:FL=1